MPGVPREEMENAAGRIELPDVDEVDGTAQQCEAAVCPAHLGNAGDLDNEWVDALSAMVEEAASEVTASPDVIARMRARGTAHPVEAELVGRLLRLLRDAEIPVLVRPV